MSSHQITLTVNGHTHTAQVPARLSLVDFLRDQLMLTGTHTGCEHGICGACSIILNGKPVRSCLIFAVQADGAEIVTVEGLAPEPEVLNILQTAFWDCHALQCGFCTPGMLISGHALLSETQSPSDEQIREGISGNLCRCTGYKQIVDAIKLAAERMRQSNTGVGDV